MAKKSKGDERDKFVQYLRDDSNEDAKRHLIFPLFHALFGEKFKSESAANGADTYIEGKLLVECKTDYNQWVEGFYQALHYQKRYGMAFPVIMVIAYKFVGIWKLNKIPEQAAKHAHTANPLDAPNAVGKHNSKSTSAALKREIQDAALYWLEPKDMDWDLFASPKDLTTQSYEIVKILKNLDSDRLMISPHNFIHSIELLKPFFENAIDAVHAFYIIVAYWDITSTLATNDTDEVRVIGFKGNKMSDPVTIAPRFIADFKKFVESHYIFTNEGSGLTVDYYFSRFDEVMAQIDPEYVKQHGIFFTDINLSRFALWFVKNNFSGKLDEDYIVFDPAGGSGNLVSSWKGKLRHKIISELQPDLLKTIERRMKVDPWHTETGFTIIPKTHENKGLNFLDRSGPEYLAELEQELNHKGIIIDKPIAFLLNPPYKNTDENQKVREDKDANYEIHPSIMELTGEDAGKERYLAFLGQILNIAKEQARKYPGLHPVVMIFTPTSWLLPRPTYIPFREKWDQYFKYHSGFIVNANAFFEVKGKWPLAFTIWTYDPKPKGNKNAVKVLDLTALERGSLKVNWDAPVSELDAQVNTVVKGSRKILLDNSRKDIRTLLPLISKKGKLIQQPRYDFSRSKPEDQRGKLVSGFPLKDTANHFELSRVCGSIQGKFIGFMDDQTPVRLDQDTCERQSNKPDRVWFRLDNDFKGINKIQAFSGTPDNRGYAGYDIESAKATFVWYTMAKVLNAGYPIWANQFDIWAPTLKENTAAYFHSLCFAFTLAENRCIVTRFEKDNPVKGAPEVFVDNPLCPTNPHAFWATTLDKEIVSDPPLAKNLVDAVKALYRLWNKNYTKGDTLKNVGLHNEAYFRHFAYPDFVTPQSGLVQIRKYAEIHGSADLQEAFANISQLTKAVREEIYRLLVEDYRYFE